MHAKKRRSRKAIRFKVQIRWGDQLSRSFCPVEWWTILAAIVTLHYSIISLKVYTYGLTKGGMTSVIERQIRQIRYRWAIIKIAVSKTFLWIWAISVTRFLFPKCTCSKNYEIDMRFSKSPFRKCSYEYHHSSYSECIVVQSLTTTNSQCWLWI